MSVPGWGATFALALLQGGLVAMPRPHALDSLRPLRSPAWAAALPGCIVVGTFGPIGARSVALGLVVLAALATPPLAAVAVLAVARGPRCALAAFALAAAVLAALASGWSGQLSAAVLTALGALTIGATMARLIPSRWILAGVVCMCAVDVVLLAAGVGQPAAAAITHAAGHVPGPSFNHAQVGPLGLDYPDLVLAAVLGASLAGQREQWPAAVLVAVLAAASSTFAPANSVWPATIPVAITLVALRTAGLPRRLDVKRFAFADWRARRSALARSPV